MFISVLLLKIVMVFDGLSYALTILENINTFTLQYYCNSLFQYLPLARLMSGCRDIIVSLTV